jgi:hypothetical protein
MLWMMNSTVAAGEVERLREKACGYFGNVVGGARSGFFPATARQLQGFRTHYSTMLALSIPARCVRVPMAPGKLESGATDQIA